jgi:hypothetical protein
LNQTLRNDILRFSAKFDHTAVSDDDISKLLGFTECNSTPHVNSARFGWRRVEDYIQVYAYVYNNGVRSIHHIADVSLDEYYDYVLIMGTTSYTFQVGEFGVVVPRTTNCMRGVYYLLQPYYGGNLPAPQDVYIHVILSQ